MRYQPATLAFVLCFSCLSCTTIRHADLQLPADVQMNSDAGRGNLLILTIRLEDGKESPVALDTGADVTCLDRSFERELGKPHHTESAHHFCDKFRARMYAAPRLFLGKTPLAKSGPHRRYVATIDCTNLVTGARRPIMGILGMDVLRNYCIQLNFNTHQVHFLDAAHSDKGNWGTAFRLTKSGGHFTVEGNLTGTTSPPSLVDTGCSNDGWLTPKAFERRTNQTEVPDPGGLVCLSNSTLGGIKYSNVCVSVARCEKVDGIGLNLLARNLVTLDFPDREMYLKQMSPESLIYQDMEQGFKFLENLLDSNGLPGLPKDADGKVDMNVNYHGDCLSGTLVFRENGQSGQSPTFHYLAAKSSGDSPWKLTRAWKSDPLGKIVKEYPVP